MRFTTAQPPTAQQITTTHSTTRRQALASGASPNLPPLQAAHRQKNRKAAPLCSQRTVAPKSYFGSSNTSSRIGGSLYHSGLIDRSKYSSTVTGSLLPSLGSISSWVADSEFAEEFT